MKMPRRLLAVSLFAIVTAVTSGGAAFADFNWNGVWAATGSNGRKTEISISNNKVRYWRSNGQNQSIAKSSVGKDSVTIKHAEGATVTLKPAGDSKLTYSWHGVSGSSSAVLSRK